MQTSTHNKAAQSEKSMEQCIADCFESFSAATKCISYCLEKGGDHSNKSHIQLMIECADICKMSMSLMLTNSHFAFEHCQLCAKICDQCSESCGGFNDTETIMSECAKACKKCAESCRSMAH